MPDTKPSEPNPSDFASIANQPTGSGVADEQAAFERAMDADDVADASIDAGVADETAAYDRAMARKHDASPQDSEDVVDGITGRH